MCIFNSVLRPFQDYFSSFETGQSVGGRKRENPEKNHLAHPQAELGLSHIFFFFFFYRLLSRSISDHYPRSCGNVTCSRPQRKAPRLRIEPGTSGTEVNHSTPAPVRSTLPLRQSAPHVARVGLEPTLGIAVR